MWVTPTSCVVCHVICVEWVGVATRPERLIDYLKNRDVDGINDCTINITIVRIATKWWIFTSIFAGKAYCNRALAISATNGKKQGC